MKIEINGYATSRDICMYATGIAVFSITHGLKSDTRCSPSFRNSYLLIAHNYEQFVWQLMRINKVAAFYAPTEQVFRFSSQEKQRLVFCILVVHMMV